MLPMQGLSLTLCLFLCVPFCARSESLSDDNYYAWLHMQGNLRAQGKLLALSDAAAVETLITRVGLVDLAAGEVREDMALLIRNGKIAWLAENYVDTDIADIRKIDASGLYLSPGLTDMHVHTHDDADYLLHLANGVTSIREMNGWSWRIDRREMVDNGALLAPNMYIASRILNSSDLGGYALAPGSEREARDAVRQARRDGFDAIKVHNGLSLELFRAIANEARVQNLPLVGHIPVAVSVGQAIEAGMHTAEHFKGYIDDSTLEISGEDWLTASIGMRMYLTPTFYTWREHQRGEAAEKIYHRDIGKLLPHRALAWRPYIDQQADALTRLRQSIRPKSEQLFRTLLPHGISWLAGTDSGGYELMVPGEALIEELEIMEALGLSPLEALRSATTRAAAAMNWSDRTGHIAPGMSADLLLLRANPLEQVSNLRQLEAVMIRGVLIEHPALLPETAAGLDQSRQAPDHKAFAAEVRAAEAHAAKGYAQSTMSIRLWAGLAGELGFRDLEQRLLGLLVP